MHRRADLKRAAVAILLAGRVTFAAAESGDLLETHSCPKLAAFPYEEFVRRQVIIAKQHNDQALRFGFKSATLRPEADIPSLLLNKQDFERQLAYSGLECQAIRYASDGLSIKGFIWKPQEISRKLPTIIYNRGGNHEDGHLSPFQKFGFYKFLVNGFVVLGSQYRQAAGSDGQDEFGGNDVNDVLNILKLARSLPYVDQDNVFMLGESRGGMMSALALKRGAIVNAAALVSPVLDLIEMSAQRPVMNSLFEELIPNFSNDKESTLRARSALAWPEAINVPILLLHGTADWRVGAGQSIELARKLQALGKPFELHIYEGDNHGLLWNNLDRDDRIIRFFKAHMTRNPTP